MTRIARTYHGARGLTGPLLFLEHTVGAALGEAVSIEQEGQETRRGQVVDAGAELTVVQILEDSFGLSPAKANVTLLGEVATTVVGRELLGRVLDGAGRPIDGLPAPVGEARGPLWGAPTNPVRRLKPSDFIETGLSAIDGMNTLVRGQKLPVFSGPGLPGLELASRIVEWARAPHGESFAVIFVAIGITERETQGFVERFAGSGASQRGVFYVNKANDPAIERLLVPRRALTQAEHLAYRHGMHVLVVMADITHYCEALREISSAREEIPGRRGYPGYMYTDLASIFERAGVLAGREGSVTQIPILTMPDDDITHPIPDLTGYITEGQIVLSRDLHRRGLFPPIDVLPSLSRLMNAGVGEGKTVAGHRAWADELYAVYARGREAETMAAIVGESALSERDRRAMRFTIDFEEVFLAQQGGRRTIEETIACGWRLLKSLPGEDLTRIDREAWDERFGSIPDVQGPATGVGAS